MTPIPVRIDKTVVIPPFIATNLINDYLFVNFPL